MKLATIVLPGILLLGSFPSMMAADKAAGPAGAGQVVLAYTNGGASTDAICIMYPLLLGDLKLESLFNLGPIPDPAKATKEHAYLIWVSDYSGILLPSGGGFTLFLIPTGTATIYFKDVPEHRDWANLPTNDRHTWGERVAKFVRKAGIFQSLDGGYTGTFTFTAQLVSSKPFKLGGETFNFKDLIPHGMTCSETGVGASETGTCVAVGDGK